MAVTVAILLLAAAGGVVTAAILVNRWRNGLPRNLLAGADVIEGIGRGVKRVVKAAADKIHGHGAEPADTGGAPEGKPGAGQSP